MQIGLSDEELQQEISRQLVQLDEAQDDAEHLGQYGELLRTMAAVAFQRAADLISANNRRIEQQLREAGIDLSRES